MSIVLFAMLLSAEPSSLTLQCTGIVSRMEDESRTVGAAVDNRGNAVGAATETEAVRDREAIVDFELAGSVARIRLPSFMRPALSSAKNGWHEVRNLAVTERMISGDVKLNFADTSRFEIDRVTGVLLTKKGFRAQCAPVDAGTRKF